jgi:hypothetical protein
LETWWEIKKWILGDVFNIILIVEEKRGDIRILYKDNKNFQSMIEDIHSIDIEA